MIPLGHRRTSRRTEDHLSATLRHLRRGRNNRPKVLANLHSEIDILGREDQFTTKRHLATAQTDTVAIQSDARCEPALLVRGPVVREEALRHNAHDLTSRNNCSTIIYATAHLNGQAHNKCTLQLGRHIDQVRQSSLGSLQQRALQQQIATRITRQRQLGKDRHRHARRLRTTHQSLDAYGVS